MEREKRDRKREMWVKMDRRTRYNDGQEQHKCGQKDKWGRQKDEKRKDRWIDRKRQ